MVKFASYSFTRLQCLSSEVTSKNTSPSLGSIIITYPAEVCSALSDGLELKEPLTVANAPRSGMSINTLYAANTFDTNKVVVEIWLGFGEEIYPEDVVLVDVGPDDVHDSCKARLRITQKRNNVKGVYKFTISGFNVFSYCVESLELTADLSDSLHEIHKAHHLVFSIEEDEVSLIVDGNDDLTDSVGYQMMNLQIAALITERPLHLWLLYSPSIEGSQDGYWKGRLHQLSMYNETLDINSIKHNFNEGITNSLPVVWNVTTPVQQNGIVGEHYDNPIYYQNPVPIEALVSIELPVYDLESSSEWNGNENASIPIMPIIVFARLPSRGTLYHPKDYSRISIGREYSSLTAVKYQPLLNAYSNPDGSAYDYFQIYAIDGVTYQSSLNTASISIIVRRINLPPIPTNETFVAFNGVSLNMVLKGVDSDGEIMGSSISTLPSLGMLRYKISDAEQGEVVPRIFSASLNYVYTNAFISESEVDAKSNLLASDCFLYRLFDSNMSYSIVASATINIYRAIDVERLNLHALQGRQSSMIIYATDKSYVSDYLCLKIVESPINGSLFDPLKTSVLGVGDILTQRLSRDDYSIGKGFEMDFISQSTKFSSPVQMLDRDLFVEKFTVRAFQCVDFNLSSIATTMEVTVQNVNDPTEISYIYSRRHEIPEYTVYPSGNVNTVKFPTTIAIDECCELLDLDQNIDVVKVEISTLSGGLITINDEASNLDFTSEHYCRSRHVAWECVGDGYDDEHLVFVGKPMDVEAAISNLKFSSPHENVMDLVKITIYDGAMEFGGNCLSLKQLDSASVYDACYVSSLTFKVNVMTYTQISLRSNRLHSLGLFINIYYYLMIICLILKLSLCYRCLIPRTCPKKNNSQKPKELPNIDIVDIEKLNQVLCSECIDDADNSMNLIKVANCEDHHDDDDNKDHDYHNFSHKETFQMIENPQISQHRGGGRSHCMLSSKSLGGYVQTQSVDSNHHYFKTDVIKKAREDNANEKLELTATRKKNILKRLTAHRRFTHAACRKSIGQL